MWKLSKTLAILLVIATGGLIGFVNTNNQNLNANPTTLIRWVDVPKTDVSLPSKININLQKEQVEFSGNTENVTVNIQKETEIKKVPVYITKEVEKVIYEPNLVMSTKLLKKTVPLTLPKINVDRQQNQ